MKNISIVDTSHAPDDWKNTHQIALDCNVTNNISRRIIGMLGNLETKKFLDSQGKERIYYCPKSVKIIKNAVNVHKSKIAPDDWKNAYQIALICNVTSYISRRIIGALDNLETKKYLDYQGKERVFYSPKSVEIIKNVVNAHKSKEAPKHWKHAQRIAKDCDVLRNAVVKIISTLGTLETLECLDRQGNIRVYYSPKSVRSICNAVKKHKLIKPPPDNWKHTHHIALACNVSDTTIKRTIIGALDNLETMQCLDCRGKVRIFYSPKSVEIISNAVKIVRDWKVVHQIALELDISTTITRKIIGTLSNLESVKCGGGKKPRTYYSPKSVEIIQEAVDAYKPTNLLRQEYRHNPNQQKNPAN